MAVTVISGMLMSTLLTLVVIPVLYSIQEGVRDRLRARREATDAELASGAAAAGTEAV
jgi:hydrophobic/amphiphilic exporter-1 (mainly G- bacteria), HAE1 family